MHVAAELGSTVAAITLEKESRASSTSSSVVGATVYSSGLNAGFSLVFCLLYAKAEKEGAVQRARGRRPACSVPPIPTGRERRARGEVDAQTQPGDVKKEVQKRASKRA